MPGLEIGTWKHSLKNKTKCYVGAESFLIDDMISWPMARTRTYREPNMGLELSVGGSLIPGLNSHTWRVLCEAWTLRPRKSDVGHELAHWRSLTLGSNSRSNIWLIGTSSLHRHWGVQAPHTATVWERGEGCASVDRFICTVFVSFLILSCQILF